MRSLRCALWASLLLVGCREKEKVGPDPSANAVSSAGSVVTASPVVDAKDERPIDRSRLMTKLDSETKRLAVVAYRAAPEEFVIGARASSAFRVHPFRDRMIVTQAGHVFMHEGDALKLDPKAVTTEKVPGNTPVLGAYEVNRIEGSWPEVLFAHAEFSTFLGPRQGSYREVRYERANGAWKTTSSIPSSITEWTPGVVLGVVGATVQVLGGTPRGPVPKQTSPEVSGACGAGAMLISVEDVAALPSGEVFAVGTRCDTRGYAMEWWKAGAETSEVLDLPDAPPNDPSNRYWYSIVAGSPTSVFVVAGNSPVEASKDLYVARFDGRALRPVETHDKGAVRDVWATSDGALFMVLYMELAKGKAALPSRLVRITKDAVYTRYVAPKKRSFETLWAKDADTAFVAGGVAVNDGILFGTNPKVIHGYPPAELSVDDPEPAAPSSAPAPDAAPSFQPFTDDCKKPFVFLYDISANSPPTFDFPTTRRAIRSFEKIADVTLLEFLFGGKRRLGARVPSGAVGNDFIAHVKANMKDEDPKLVCFDPTQGVRVIEVR